MCSTNDNNTWIKCGWRTFIVHQILVQTSINCLWEWSALSGPARVMRCTVPRSPTVADSSGGLYVNDTWHTFYSCTGERLGVLTTLISAPRRSTK